MYSIAEIAAFMAHLFNEMDTSIGSTISIPQGMNKTCIVTKSVTFWSAWMKFQQKVAAEQEIGLNVELFKVDTDGEQPVRPISTGSYNVNDILKWVKDNPHTMFYMSIRYRSRQTAERGIFTFAHSYQMN